jgi:hypothetical protein
MRKSTRGFVFTALLTTVGTGFPTPLTKGGQQGTATPVSATAGKILWQFNTNG